MRRLSLSPSALLALVAVAATGCSRLSVEWTTKPQEIAITGRGFADAMLVILAGPPTGPLVRREVPGVWSTIGLTPGQGFEVTRVPFDGAGVARVTIPASQLPAGKTLIQALVITGDEKAFPLAISDCMAVTYDDGVPTLRHHALDVLSSPVSVRLLAVVALILACILLRRLRLGPTFGRGPRLALVFLCAAFLFLGRVVTPSASDRTRKAEVTPPLWPTPVAADKQPLDPLDRVSGPGFRDLVDHARTQTPEGASIAILPAADSGEAYRDAWQAAWLVWPHRAEILPRGADPFARRGIVVILGAGPKSSGGSALFSNQAGVVWSLEEGEPR